MAKESEDIRAFAKKRVKAQREFKQLLWVWLVVSILVIAIWALTGAGYFWPMWPILGVGVAALFAGLDAYGRLSNRPITEADIDKEIKRLGK